VTRVLRAQAGFTLIEVLAAMLVLALGAGAAFTLIDAANRSVTSNNARTAATNLQRELAEYARGTDYDLLQPAQLVPALRKHGAVQGTLSGGTWTIERRGVTYVVDASVCTFDDPKDGLSATPPANACPAAAPVAGAPSEVNPDDFRKVTVTTTWTKRGRSGKSTQSTLIVNPAGALGPRIVEFTEPTVQVLGDSLQWGPTLTLHLKSTAAAAVHWTTDDLTSGDATGGPTDWTFTWNLGTRFSTTTPWVRDGTYTIQAQAFDGRGVPGEARIVTVHINRGDPRKVGVTAGYNASRNFVDMHWKRYDERDLQGYVVIRNADNKQICPKVGALQEAVSCTDESPLSSSTYSVYALDCVDLLNGVNCTHRGAADTTPALGTSTPSAPGAPGMPTGLTAAVIDGKPTLTWTAPSAGPAGPILLYRMYREDGTGPGGRYDETVTADTTYTDPTPGSTTAHTYRVTAVDQNFNEGPPSDPILAPPLP
jgi:prepilin-type N-terminal cleavage/methylation domain-containing protein